MSVREHPAESGVYVHVQACYVFHALHCLAETDVIFSVDGREVCVFGDCDGEFAHEE